MLSADDEVDPAFQVFGGALDRTATDFDGHSGHQTVTEGTDAIVTLATESPDASTGRFIDRFGPVSW